MISISCLGPLTANGSLVTGASGLVLQGNNYYVVCDDSVTLFRGSPWSRELSSLDLGLAPLPSEHKARKAAKPDWESLVSLGEALLLLPSGSTASRHLAIAYHFDEEARRFSVDPLWKALRQKIPGQTLNIEGCAVSDTTFYFAHRANETGATNVLFKCPKSDLLPFFLRGETPVFDRITAVTTNLGKNFGLTDLCWLPEQNALWFLAAAEATENSYDDGAFEGAVLGYFSEQGDVAKTWPLKITDKPEGLAWHDGHFYIVTDADNADIAAGLWQVVAP